MDTINLPKLITYCLPFWAFFIGWTYWSSDFIFFWDNIVQVSIPAHWYFENGFSAFFLPDEVSTGQVPIVGMYVAICWLVFGKSLAVAHWAMLPFLLGIVWQLNQLIHYFIPQRFHFWVLFLVLIDSVLLSQFALVTPEIPLVFFFLWAINCVLYEKRYQLIWAILFLGIISMRGMICVGVIFVFDVVSFLVLRKNKISFYPLLPYLPFLILFSSFLFIHYQSQGWVIHNTVSNRWDSADEWNSWKGMIRNAGILTWRILDQGRIALFVIFAIILLKRKFWMSKIKSQPKLFNLSLLTGLSLALFVPVLVLYQSALAQRYLMPFYIFFGIYIGYIIIHFIEKERRKKIAFIVLILSLGLGHFWVYPPKIAQSWASTTAHFPYHQLRVEMLQYIDQKEIPLQYIGTSFPNIGSIKYMDCSERETGFVEKDLATQKYILYSNVYNDFSDQELADLKTTWIEEKRLEKGQVYVILYKKND